MTIVDLELAPLERRTPGKALSAVAPVLDELEQWRGPRPAHGWNTSTEACEQLLTWLHDPQH